MPGVGVSGLEKKRYPVFPRFFAPPYPLPHCDSCNTVKNGGTTETQHKAVRLCPVDERGTSKRVKALVMKEQADEIKRWLEPANIAKKSPETIRTVAGFVTDVYLPFVQLHKRASTLKGYTDMWEDHVSR